MYSSGRTSSIDGAVPSTAPSACTSRSVRRKRMNMASHFLQHTGHQADSDGSADCDCGSLGGSIQSRKV